MYISFKQLRMINMQQISPIKFSAVLSKCGFNLTVNLNLSYFNTSFFGGILVIVNFDKNVSIIARENL